MTWAPSSAGAVQEPYKRPPLSTSDAVSRRGFGRLRLLLGRPAREDLQRLLAPPQVLPLERQAAHQRQVRPDALGFGEVVVLEAAVQQPRAKPLVAGDLRLRPAHPLLDRAPDRLPVARVDRLDLDQQLVADHTGARRAGRELVQGPLPG